MASSEPSPGGKLAISLPRVWAVAAVTVPIAATIRTLSTPDLAYLVRAGDIMLRSGSILRSDRFTATVFGRPWLNQQWASESISALFFRWQGWLGLAVLQVLLVGGTLALVFLACREAGAHSRRAAALTLLFLPVTFGVLMLRAQLFGTLLLSLTLWVLARRHDHPVGLWALPFVTVAWANLHGTFFLAPALLVLAAVQDLRTNRALARTEVVLAAISAVATLANPFGWRVWTYVLSIPTSSVVTKNIEEWQPTSVLQITGAFFFASVVGVVGLLLWRRRTIAWQETLSLLVFFGAGLVAVRWARWWGIAAPIFLAAILRDVRPRRPELESRNVLNTAIAGALIGAVLLAIPWSLGSSRLPAGPHLAFAPPGITQALEEHLHPGDRIFNAERWGSWLEFAFPQSLVFVDSRIELFPDRVWRDYEGVSDARQGWPAILDRYRIAVIVAHRETQPYLIRAAERDPRWERVYADEDGVVLVRR